MTRPGNAVRALGIAAGLVVTCLTGAAAQEVKAIKPGMSEAEVRSAWGDPFTVRKAGIMSYLYYRNDCLKRCGTYDIVFLEHGQVVDAVIRDRSRRYDGIASSPADRKPEPTIRQ
ncbi:MAG: hypothetical protein ABI742_11090 [Gemmatimonadota bacterium]